MHEIQREEETQRNAVKHYEPLLSKMVNQKERKSGLSNRISLKHQEAAEHKLDIQVELPFYIIQAQTETYTCNHTDHAKFS